MKGPGLFTDFLFQFCCQHNRRQVNCVSIKCPGAAGPARMALGRQRFSGPWQEVAWVGLAGVWRKGGSLGGSWGKSAPVGVETRGHRPGTVPGDKERRTAAEGQAAPRRGLAQGSGRGRGCVSRCTRSLPALAGPPGLQLSFGEKA